jgi:hypothetical protein
LAVGNTQLVHGGQHVEFDADLHEDFLRATIHLRPVDQPLLHWQTTRENVLRYIKVREHCRLLIGG